MREYGNTLRLPLGERKVYWAEKLTLYGQYFVSYTFKNDVTPSTLRPWVKQKRSQTLNCEAIFEEALESMYEVHSILGIFCRVTFRSALTIFAHVSFSPQPPGTCQSNDANEYGQYFASKFLSLANAIDQTLDAFLCHISAAVNMEFQEVT